MKNHDTAEKVFTPQKQRNVSRHKNRRAAKASYTATEAKNEFGRLLEQATQGTTVLITKHNYSPGTHAVPQSAAWHGSGLPCEHQAAGEGCSCCCSQTCRGLSVKTADKKSIVTGART